MALSEKSLAVGIDFGTSGCRAIAIDAAGTVQAEVAQSLPAPQRYGPAVEQAPARWAEALETLLAQLTRAVPATAIGAIAVDATSGTVLLADADGTPLGNALMYNDGRATAEAAAIAAVAPRQSAAHGTTSGLAKLLWLLRQPGAAPAAHLLTQTDYLNSLLGAPWDVSDANSCLKSGYDAINHRWPDWLDELGVPRVLLPQVVSPGTPIGRVRPALAARHGLAPDTLIAAGTTDSTAAFLATGACRPGEAATSLGSTLVLKVVSERPVFAPEYGVYSQPLARLPCPRSTAAAAPLVLSERTPSGRLDVAPTTPSSSSGGAPAERRLDALATNGGGAGPGLWLVGGGSNSGGAVLRQYFSDVQMAALTPRLAPDRSTGLDYYPLPAPGERFPISDPTLPPRLTPRPPDDAVFFQGLLEGIARIEQRGYQLLTLLGAPALCSVRSVGGGTGNPAWSAIRAALLGVPLLAPRHRQAAYGAALLARRALEDARDYTR